MTNTDSPLDDFREALQSLKKPDKFKDFDYIEAPTDDLIRLHELYCHKQVIEANIEILELLRWKYKELNDQSVSYEVLEAYNLLMDDLKAELRKTL